MFVPPGYEVPEITGEVTEGQTALLHSWSNDVDAAHSLRQLSIPTLILAAEDDKVLPSFNGDMLASEIAHAQLLKVRFAGHAMMYQYPHQLADAINSFVAKSAYSIPADVTEQARKPH
jgi:pimeloyl-ACP methyl ester carboxylesterase